MKKLKSIFVIALMLCLLLCASCCHASEDARIPIKVLILSKFELGINSEGTPGEGRFYCEEYLKDAEEYEIKGGVKDHKLYVKDGVALYTTGMGKTSAALSTMAVLLDDRFDFSEAFILSTGCAGSSSGNTVIGDVFVITSAVDYDLGHKADIRDMTDQSAPTWFHDSIYDDSSCFRMDPDLMDRVYELVKDVNLQTTKDRRKTMQKAFSNKPKAWRDPIVQRGTTVSGDNYWKGEYDHRNAELIVETYKCPDPYVSTEMEDVAVAAAADRMGMLDRLIILRASVNMDTFILGNTPETLWTNKTKAKTKSKTEGHAEEIIKFFPLAMDNNFRVGKVIVDAILEGAL